MNKVKQELCDVWDTMTLPELDKVHIGWYIDAYERGLIGQEAVDGIPFGEVEGWYKEYMAQRENRFQWNEMEK